VCCHEFSTNFHFPKNVFECPASDFTANGSTYKLLGDSIKWINQGGNVIMTGQTVLAGILALSLGLHLCEAQSCSQLQSRAAQAKAALQRDVRAMTDLHLGFEKTADELQQWAEIGEKAQKEAHDQFMQGVAAFVLQSAQAGTKAYGSLTPPQANKYITKLKNFGIDSKPWFDSLREIANTPGKPIATRPTTEALDRLTHLMDGIEALPKPQQEDARTALTAGVVSLVGGYVAKGPVAGFTLAGWSFITSLGWSATSRATVPERINQLMNLSDEQWRALPKLEALVHQHVSAIQDSEKAMASQGCVDPNQAMIGTWSGAPCGLSDAIVLQLHIDDAGKLAGTISMKDFSWDARPSFVAPGRGVWPCKEPHWDGSSITKVDVSGGTVRGDVLTLSGGAGSFATLTISGDTLTYDWNPEDYPVVLRKRR
jgi:hypothetical protein